MLYRHRDRASDLVETEPYEGPESRAPHKGGASKSIKITHKADGATADRAGAAVVLPLRASE